MNKEELQMILLAKAEASIAEVLQDKRLHDHMTLSAIEKVVGDGGDSFRQAVLEEIMKMQQNTPTTCPECEGKLRNKGKRRKQVVSLQGDLELERPYYQCETCRTGHFPPR